MIKRTSFFVTVELVILILASFAYPQTTPHNQTPPSDLLLKDYRPRSIYGIPSVVIKKAKYPVIDMAARPFAKSEEELSEWVRAMDSSGIRKAVVLTDAYGAKFDSLTAFYSKYPGRFILFCGFDFSGYNEPGYGPAAVAELRRCFREGARGVGELTDESRGLIPDRPYGPHIDDPGMAPLLNECAALGMPVSIRIGEPQWFYESMDSANDGLMNAYEGRFQMGWDLNLAQELDHLARAVAEHPGTIFIARDYANQLTELSKLGRLFQKYSNLYADIAGGYSGVATIPRYAKSFIEKYKDRILYGTNLKPDRRMYQVTFTILETKDEHFYETELLGYHWPLYGLGLSDGTLKEIYWSNAARILKIRN